MLGMTTFLSIAAIMLGSLLLGALLLHLIPRLGPPGRAVSDWLCQAPGLDLLVTYFTALPMILGPILAGWTGFAAAIVSQILAVMIWTFFHGLLHPAARRGPRIVTFLNALVGPWRNSLVVWVMLLVVPVFWIIRVSELVTYPFLIWLIRFPRYKQSDWVRSPGTSSPISSGTT